MAEKYDYLTGRGDPSATDTANEVTASFVPGLNVAQALRDYKKAAEDKDYVGQGLSMLGLVPGGGAAVKGAAALKAALLPAMTGLYKHSPTIEKNVARLVSRADDIIKQGGKSADVEKELGLFKWPGAVEQSPAHPKWGMEIEPGTLKIPEVNSMSRLYDVLDNPELYEHVPGLRSTRVHFGGEGGRISDMAHFDPLLDAIKVSDRAAYRSVPEVKALLDHEISHATMHHLGQKSAAGYTGVPMLDSEQYAHAMEMVNRLRSMGHEKAAGELRSSMNHSIAGTSWRMDAGEKLADLDSIRSAAGRGEPLTRLYTPRSPRSILAKSSNAFLDMEGKPVSSSLTDGLRRVMARGGSIDEQTRALVEHLRATKAMP